VNRNFPRKAPEGKRIWWGLDVTGVAWESSSSLPVGFLADSPPSPGTEALHFGVARLKRLDEVYADYPVYFVTACTSERRELLARECVLRAVVEYGERGPERGAWLGSFVLMPDHLHAFVAIDGEPRRLSA
jgi:hypothetical protein